MLKTVLFVDDEPRLLDGLQRLLRPQRKVWTMRFAGGGEEALGIMQREKIDVVVTDMRMPGMDGAELLRLICERYPGVARIVLSGQFDPEAGMRAAPFAHQFLVKPCDPAQLISAVERTSDCACGMQDEAIRNVVNAIGSLPSPPETCLRLLDVIQQPDVPLEKIARIIDQDVALAAKVMQMVNSAFFSLPREVHSVLAAVNVLGLDVLRQLVISLEIQKRYHQLPALPRFSFQEFDRHSRLTAKIAGILPANPSARAGGPIAALLHDTGKLVLATQRTAAFAEACNLAHRDQIPMHEAERRIFGVTHAEIGAYLLNMWGFPRPAVDAIAVHHRPAPASEPQDTLDLAALIHISNAIALSLHQPPEELPATLDLDYARSLGVLAKIPSWRAAAEDLTA